MEPGTILPIHRHRGSTENGCRIEGKGEAESLESGAVILECKDGRYEVLGEEDIMR